MRPIGSTSESDTEFDRMKQVCIILFYDADVGFLFSSCIIMIVSPVNSQHRLVLQEILDEVVRELHRVKDEIINGEQCSESCQGHETF